MKKSGTCAQTLGWIKKVCQRSKRSQMKLSFGMIFSVILIIVFLVFAFYVIKMLLGGQEDNLVLMFKEKLQEDIDKIWRGAGSISDSEGYKLPKKIELVCFVDFSRGAKGTYKRIYDELEFQQNGDENLFFYPTDSLNVKRAFETDYVDIRKITKDKNPYCVETKKSKVYLTIKREYGEEFVLIEEQDE